MIKQAGSAVEKASIRGLTPFALLFSFEGSWRFCWGVTLPCPLPNFVWVKVFLIFITVVSRRHLIRQLEAGSLSLASVLCLLDSDRGL
jgi:hypothetical protein